MKSVFRRLSIHHKLVLLIVAISGIVLSFSAFLIYRNQINILEHSAIEYAQTKASLISDNVKSAIVFRDMYAAHNSLSLLERDSTIESAYIILADKTVFAIYEKRYHEVHDKKHQMDYGEEHLNNQKSTATKILDDIDFEVTQSISKGHLNILYAIRDHESILGYLYLQNNFNKLNEQRIDYLKILSSILGFSIILAFFLSHFFKQVITNPIDKMVRHVKNLSTSKDYSMRLSFPQTDELGTLSKGFNQMLDVVQAREKDLENHSANLQKIVDKRTEQLYQRAHFDSLTGLPNRALFLDRLGHAISSANRNKTKLALLFSDLDHFKRINDSLGHDVGDQLLIAVGHILSKIGRENDTVARLGGDEFVILLENIKHAEDAANVAKKVCEALNNPIQLDGHQLQISTSIGIALYPENAKDAKSLLKNADISMYQAKQQSQQKYSFFNAKMNKPSLERLEIENQLSMALENKEFSLTYQPQVLLKSKRVVHVEALLRWKNPKLGQVLPKEFLSIAEEIGLMNQIGDWVIIESFRQLAEWQSQGLSEMTVSINLSASQLLSSKLIPHIRAQAEKYKIALAKLEVEVVEGVFLDHFDKANEALSILQSLGVKVTIDNFGSAFSSLRHLKNLPVNTLKLDGIFIRQLKDNKANQGVLSAIILLAHSLDMKLVAKQVETKEQLDFLLALNGDYAQGNFLYPPLDPTQILTLKLNH